MIMHKIVAGLLKYDLYLCTKSIPFPWLINNNIKIKSITIMNLK